MKLFKMSTKKVDRNCDLKHIVNKGYGLTIGR